MSDGSSANHRRHDGGQGNLLHRKAVEARLTIVAMVEIEAIFVISAMKVQLTIVVVIVEIEAVLIVSTTEAQLTIVVIVEVKATFVVSAKQVQPTIIIMVEIEAVFVVRATDAQLTIVVMMEVKAIFVRATEVQLIIVLMVTMIRGNLRRKDGDGHCSMMTFTAELIPCILLPAWHGRYTLKEAICS